jgi:hypothetical protein
MAEEKELGIDNPSALHLKLRQTAALTVQEI